MWQVRSVAKAIASGCAAFTGSVTTAITGDGVVTGVEWAVIAATTVGAAALTWAIPNSAPDEPVEYVGRHERAGSDG